MVELMTVPDAASMLGVSARHLWRLIDGGQTPPVVRLGRTVRINRRAIEKWILDGCPDVRKSGWTYSPASEGGRR